MNTGQSDPLMCFNTFILLAFGLNSTVKPGGAMLPFAPPLLPAAKPGGPLLPLAPLHWRPCILHKGQGKSLPNSGGKLMLRRTFSLFKIRNFSELE